MIKYSYVVLVALICCFLLYSSERNEQIFASLVPKSEVTVATKITSINKESDLDVVRETFETSSTQVVVQEKVTTYIVENCVTGFSEPVEKKQKPKVRDGDKRYADYMEAYFKKAVEKLNEFEFKGPFAEEVARYAIARQIIEDGVDREHKVSMVGMVPGGLNKRVVARLGLELNKVNDSGYKLTRITANDGQGCYAFYGDFSNVLGTVAVVMVWDEYVNGEEGFLRKEELRSAWNKSKELSDVLAKEPNNQAIRLEYTLLEKERREAIERCNSMYGPNGSSVKMIVKNMKDVFDFLLD